MKDCDYYLDSSVQNHLMVGSHNLADYNEILTCDKQELVKKIKSSIEPYFNKDGKKLVIICIRDVLKEDSDIDDACSIGFEEGYTKQDIVYKQIFNFSELIANVFYIVQHKLIIFRLKKELKKLKAIQNNKYIELMKLYLMTKFQLYNQK